MITIVSGLPRSGTSLLMQMLEAGGMDIVTDNMRIADTDNTKGYYEFEPVKKLEADNSWLAEAEGKCLKVISLLLRALPDNHQYKVIFMSRDMPQLLASQQAMLKNRNEKHNSITDAIMAKHFEAHLEGMHKWIENSANIDVIYVDYDDVLDDSKGCIDKIINFLEVELDGVAMADVIKPTMNHHRD